MKLVLISPRLAIQKGDFLGSGVPYWPIELATLASFAKNCGDEVLLVDLFGNNPSVLSDEGSYFLQGDFICNYLGADFFHQAEGFVLYAISYMSHKELLSIVANIKLVFPKTPIAILENSQAVTAYSLQRVMNDYFEAGADLLICGEPYFNWDEIKLHLLKKTSELIPRNLIKKDSLHVPERMAIRNMRYPIPAWDLVNLRGYWKIPYSHGPKTSKYLPILTSRGCPYCCDFCVVPETNNRHWHGNDPEEVVREMLVLRDRFGVHDFQVEDLNPTVRSQRWERICELLIERKANIRFYFVSGIKAETIHINKLPLFYKAGCRYISISPESGSERLMDIIGKKFDYQYGIDLIASCRESGIRTQACFLVGHPDETDRDFKDSKRYLAQLVRHGLDEVAVFIVAPFAGSKLHQKNYISMTPNTSLISFSPKGRVNYETLACRRNSLILVFFVQKLKNDFSLWFQVFRSLIGNPETKMENLPRRIIFIYWLIIRFFLKKKERKIL